MSPLPNLKALLNLPSKDGTLPRRPLTPPLRKTLTQTPCLLFALPPEIRLQIYHEVISSWNWGTKIHIHRSTHFRREKTGPGYLTAIPCVAVERTQEEWEAEQPAPSVRTRTRLGLETYGVFPDACLECANGYWKFLNRRVDMRWEKRMEVCEDKLAMFVVCRRIKLQIIWSWRLPKYMMNPPKQTALGWTVRKLQVEDWKEGDGLVGAKVGEKSLPFPIERREVLGDNNWRSVRGIVGVGSFDQAKLYVQIPAHLVAIILVPPVVAVYVVKKTIIKFDQKLEQDRKRKARMALSGKN
ncbi:hypothetical protein M7I_0975 [Glarea lozoyensis 74030]|uniref:Uncharacterized protein n=1 Tax=Glarea lozoyensis (strain ATCC 74030 / MF5533) TaxID=1104152 RepID=H0EEU1_GLAL7|nr:hypothetical protein M7I_0975 [Glarea lozoyensis 74030]